MMEKYKIINAILTVVQKAVKGDGRIQACLFQAEIQVWCKKHSEQFEVIGY